MYGRLGWASIQCLRHLIPFVFVRMTRGNPAAPEFD
jgi:hypothetical protein